MHLRDSIADVPHDDATFRWLVSELARGGLDPAANRLKAAPRPLQTPPRSIHHLEATHRARLEQIGLRALREGRIAVVILNGGMATRFGGGAKGVVSVIAEQPNTSFLAVKLADIRQRAEAQGARVATVLMNSFATREATDRHLDAIAWSRLEPRDRYTFIQSIMPRVLPDGTPLAESPHAQDLNDEQLYAAPGHGDTLPRLVESGTWAALTGRGVEHVMVSNVDNLGADLDPVIVGAHLEAVESGAKVTVEVVPRQDGDQGGCVAELPGSPGQGAIIEGFRLPVGMDLASFPHFNTNTLWLALEAFERPEAFPLQWFSVTKTIEWATGAAEVVQFERLIGQITEFVPTAFIEVDRDQRFLPIKTRQDLEQLRPRLREHALRAGLVSG